MQNYNKLIFVILINLNNHNYKNIKILQIEKIIKNGMMRDLLFA